MSSSASRDSDSTGPLSFYSRKEKSLGVLCSKFLELYDRVGVETIGLDEAARRLGVERRRIYDIVNILESVGVLARKVKNQYTWKGFQAIPRALEELKVEGLRENSNTSDCYTVEVEVGEPSNTKSLVQDDHSALKVDNRKEKSLGLLTQNFLKLFLCFNLDLISLDNAAKALLGASQNSMAMRTKVRRLYDIANVLSSMNLIEKIHHPESGKPALKWLGMRRRPKNISDSHSDQEESIRVFGTEITNNFFKRIKVDDSSDEKNLRRHTKQDNLEGKKDTDEVEQKNCLRNFEFGPFAPVNLHRAGDSATKNVRHIQDLEALASTYSPQYYNEALSDLFVHYSEACKSWYVEIGRKKKQQPTEPSVVMRPSVGCMNYR